MELRNFRPIIILFGVTMVLLFILVIINAMSNNSSNNIKDTEEENEKINYPKVEDSPEEILSKVYNEKRDYYTGFLNNAMEHENIFGNLKEVNKGKLSITTRMAITLNSFDVNDLGEINCNTISWNSNWKGSCGSNKQGIAYYIPVSDFNLRSEEIFNMRLDYSLLNIDDLKIGTCTGPYSDSYVFRYIKEQSIFVSMKKDYSCKTNGILKVTDVSKTQSRNLLTLTVSYSKMQASLINGKYYYGSPTNYQDKFFFDVNKNGKYYFRASTLVRSFK